MTLATEAAARSSAESQITEAVSAGTTLTASLSGLAVKRGTQRADVIEMIKAVPTAFPNVFEPGCDLADRPAGEPSREPTVPTTPASSRPIGPRRHPAN